MSEPSNTPVLYQFADRIRHSLGVKLFVIGGIMLLLLIPAFMIFNLISERQRFQAGVVNEISSKWGAGQTITGPLLVINASREQNLLRDGKPVTTTVSDQFLLSPEVLQVDGTLEPQVRYRGIYEAILYRGEFRMSGRFELPAAPAGWKFDLEHMALALPVSDLGGIRSITVTAAGRPLNMHPGMNLNSGRRAEVLKNGIAAALPGNGPADRTGFDFDIQLEINGSEQIDFLPLGRVTAVKLASTWPSPSFQGRFLPEKRRVDAAGFQAEYHITELNRNFPQLCRIGDAELNGNEFGVALVQPANIYTQVSRSAKYALLFIVSGLLALLFAERIARVSVHPAQYLIAGLAIVMFYAILLGVAEHIGFGGAFLTSSVLTAGALGMYCRMVFRSMRTALSLSLLLLAGYGILYVILQLEDFALLVGVGVLFVLLLALMLITGRMNREAEA